MRIAISCSKTGGHIFPALSLAKKLKNERVCSEIIFFVPKSRLLEFLIKEFKVKYSSIKRLSLVRNFFESFSLLRDFNPDVVIGFGGITSIPLLLEAKILGIKTIIHEQNVIPGRANRFLSFFVDRICIGFSETKNYFFNKRRVIFTGNPLREEIGTKSKIESLKFFDLALDRFTLLVMGGSQGSSKINSVILETLSFFKENNLQLIHITGPRDYSYVKDSYEKIRFKNFRVFDFLEEMSYAYGAADLVVCRAGAMTISEITRCGLASILIPYPYVYGHQKENALLLARNKAALLIEDRELCSSHLKNVIFDLKNNRDKLQNMASKAKELGSSEAVEKLAGLVLNG